MEQTKITIDAGNLDDMQKLLGTFDENLNIVTRSWACRRPWKVFF